jgi:tRNA G37 N-methylase Trm5
VSRVAISADVADVLSRSTVEGQVLRLPEGQLDRKLYTSVNNVLTALGGKWDRRAGGHTFMVDPEAMLADALGAGHATSTKKAFEQFFTPQWLAEKMARRLDLKDGDHCLEPSAGIGHLAETAVAWGANVTAIELDPTLMQRLIESGHGRFGWLRAINADFMSWTPPIGTSIDNIWFDERIDAVMMNPPFSKGQDVRHFMRAWAMLAPGGRIAAIMGEHAFFATDALSRDFRAFLERIGATVERLPAGTFKEAGTSVDTRLIVATKAAG